MKFIIATKDGKFFVKTHTHARVEYTNKRELAMRFKTRAEANRLGMVVLGGDFTIEKHP